jgi:hypothetical protein
MQPKRTVHVFLSIVMLIVLTLAVYPSLAQGTAADASAVMYIGRVSGFENEFVGLAVQGDSAVIYICDGQADKGTVSVAEWFVGAGDSEVIDITAKSGNRVEAQVAATTAVGKFTFTDGSTKTFSLELVTDGNSGLLRSEFRIADHPFIAGWLVLPDGSVRGAVFDSETGDLSPASLVSYVPNFVVNSEEAKTE